MCPPPRLRPATRYADTPAPACPPPSAPEQVLLRVQWQRDTVRGASLRLEADFAGFGLLVMGGLQDELFNLTFDDLKAAAVSSRLELTVRSVVSRRGPGNALLPRFLPVLPCPAIASWAWWPQAAPPPPHPAPRPSATPCLPARWLSVSLPCPPPSPPHLPHAAVWQRAPAAD
jgi:hypothetical protein